MRNVTRIEDARIIAALDAGDVETAALLAAQLPKPAAYLWAMQEVNRIVSANLKGKRMMIELAEQSATLTKYNPRPELHGQDPTPAADIKFMFNAANGDILPMLDPVLRGFLFHKNGAISHDLANATHDAPNLRFPKLQGPFEWLSIHDEAELTLHRGIGGKSDLKLPVKLRKPILIAPQEGGTCIVTMQVQCHPDEKQAGALYMLMGKPITVSFDPGEESDDDDGEDDPKAGGEE